MNIFYRSLFVTTLLWSISLSVFASESEIVNSGRAKVQLVTSHDSALPGSDIHIALSMRLEKHWHTYWRNAGGPGMPADFLWTLPETLSVGETIWPLPQITYTQTIVNYVFEDRLLLPMVLHISKDAKLGETITIQAEAAYLVCYQVCLPESAKLSLSLTIGEPVLDGRWSANIRRAVQNAPKAEAGFKGAARLKDKTLTLDIAAKDLRAGQYKNAYFYPYIQDLIDADAPQTLSQGKNGLQLSMPAGWVLDEGIKEPITGVISYDKKIGNDWARKGVIVSLAPNASVDLGAISTPSESMDTPSKTLIILIGLALLAGVLIGLKRVFKRRQA